VTQETLQILSKNMRGEFHSDALHKRLYATDASVYRKLPVGVAYPKDFQDLKLLIDTARDTGFSLIPRAAGTSLSGQCVGDGLVVDISKHFTHILAFDEQKRTVTVQPGLIRDDLNRFLQPYGLFFGPNTSTSNRCTIGGMVGNNSSGSTSIQYGVTRDKVLAVKALLSDSSEALFTEVSKEDFMQKITGNKLENHLYKSLKDLLSEESVQEGIRAQFPKPEIHRRNTGYALDTLIDSNLFREGGADVNLAKLICGSEGTLCFITEVTLALDPLPPPENNLVAVHFHSIAESLSAVSLAMEHNLYLCELMDKAILDCTKNNRQQQQNRFFIEGDPKAVLLLELRADSRAATDLLTEQLVNELQQQGHGYAYPVLKGSAVNHAIELRKAGLGVLGNMIGDRKAVACIEDTAVALADLPAYIAEFTAMMASYDQSAVYYAHAGAGELHLRPILNLKKGDDVALFRTITTEVAKLVKKYKGSLSGEHGDGIVRSEFIPLMIGKENYQLLKAVKKAFDPAGIFNQGKITDPLPMDAHLRYQQDRIEPTIKTFQDFSDSLGILRMAEKCNGSGDCRKPVAAGGAMCPSFRATQQEKDTTRARANAFREFLTEPVQANRFDHEELKAVFDLCISCKACASECPSNVDIAALKAEFLYQYQQIHPPSFGKRLFANHVRFDQIGSLFPRLSNWMLNSYPVKKILGIATERNLPALHKTSLRKWYRSHLHRNQGQSFKQGDVYLFCDEFSNYYEVDTGIDTVELLTELGYRVRIIEHGESARSLISKGFLGTAKKIVDQHIDTFTSLISEKTPLVGIEPSAILGFRDEYLRLAEDKSAAKELAKHSLTIEEFISREFKKGKIQPEAFSQEKRNLKIHVHCHQQSLSHSSHTFTMLNIPINYQPTIMATGCCGMAGSFGYEQEHYQLSMAIGEQSLFPKLRKTGSDVLIAAAGTSCRHQISAGTTRTARHPVSILREALL